MKEDKIPKIIHYVWLGRGKKPMSVRKCINSWKTVMPDYEIIEWNEDNFDLSAVPWTKESIKMRKWSLASDYIRHYVLFNIGGIYMDTDVMAYKRFDEFLNHDFFSSVEYHPKVFNKVGNKQVDKCGNPLKEGDAISGLGILAALIGAKKGNPFIKECMDFFGNRHFIQDDGSLFINQINPDIMATLAVKHGFKYKDVDQLLEGNIMIYNSSVFAGDPHTWTKKSYSMHFCDNSWVDRSLYKEITHRITRFLRKYNFKW